MDALNEVKAEWTQAAREVNETRREWAELIRDAKESGYTPTQVRAILAAIRGHHTILAEGYVKEALERDKRSNGGN